MRPLLLAALLVSAAACESTGRSVRTWIEARDATGHAVAGATVTIDGRPLGITDHRGLFRVKLRRHVGETVALSLLDEREGEPLIGWEGSFVVGTHGGVAGSTSDRLVVTLARTR